jgi:DNA-binding PadR family transcriptional regulator
LDLAILGLLEERELHGYEIRRRVREQLGLLANVSFGSLYPALNRLENAGAVASAEQPVTVAPSSAPPTGSLSGELAVLRARRLPAPRGGRRARKMYQITDEGRRRFAELLSGGGVDDARSFGLRLAFAKHLAPQARLALLERRRNVLGERLGEARAAVGDVSLDSYARSVVEHTADSMEDEIRWINRLIDAERAQISVGAAAKAADQSEGERP